MAQLCPCTPCGRPGLCFWLLAPGSSPDPTLAVVGIWGVTSRQELAVCVCVSVSVCVTASQRNHLFKTTVPHGLKLKCVFSHINFGFRETEPSLRFQGKQLANTSSPEQALATNTTVHTMHSGRRLAETRQPRHPPVPLHRNGILTDL